MSLKIPKTCEEAIYKMIEEVISVYGVSLDCEGSPQRLRVKVG